MKKKAVAVQYVSGLPAPFVIAKGENEIARRIVEVAEQAGVTVMPMTDLAESLFVLDVGDYIPEEFYQVIAEILVFVQKVKAGS